MKRKYTHEEVRQWMVENNQHFFYANSNDTNFIVRKRYGFAWTVNIASPWVFRAIISVAILIFLWIAWNIVYS